MVPFTDIFDEPLMKNLIDEFEGTLGLSFIFDEKSEYQKNFDIRWRIEFENALKFSAQSKNTDV